MSQSREQSLEIIQNYYSLFNSGDREALLAMLDEDVTHDINQGQCEIGRDAFRSFLERMDRCYEEHVESLVIMSDASGSRCAAEFFIRGKYIATDQGLPPAAGQLYYLQVGAFFEIIDNQIERISNYYNLQDWLSQVAG
jgi:steroid delta-isomerase-like uncharacterized protein